MCGCVWRVWHCCQDKSQLYESTDQSSDQVRRPLRRTPSRQSQTSGRNGQAGQKADNFTFWPPLYFWSGCPQCTLLNTLFWHFVITIEKKESNICSTWVKSCSRYQAFCEPSISQKQFFCETILAFVTWEIWLALDSIRGFLCTASSPIFLSGAELNFPRKFWTLEMLAHATGPPPSCRAVSLQGRGMMKLRMLFAFCKVGLLSQWTPRVNWPEKLQIDGMIFTQGWTSWFKSSNW